MSNIDFSQTRAAADERRIEADTLKTRLAHLRWQAEVGGITWRNGLTLQSGPEALAGLHLALRGFGPFGLGRRIWWKCANGWDRMGRRELREALRRVERHVQNCFAAEHRVSLLIDRGDITAANLPKAFHDALRAVRK